MTKYLNKSKSDKPTKHVKRIDYEFHKQSLEELVTTLNTSLMDGLSSSESAKRLKQHGKNLIKPYKQNILIKLVSYLFTGFCGLLWQVIV